MTKREAFGLALAIAAGYIALCVAVHNLARWLVSP